MAAAARVHAVERGRDVRSCTMVAFGGAAPLHACRLADKLGIDRIIIPCDAGVGSAIGFLRAPVSYEAVRTRYQRLDAFDAVAVGEVLATLAEEAGAVVAAAAADQPTVASCRAAMRYVGQGHEVDVEIPLGTPLDPADLRIRFEAAYHALYERSIPHLAVEVLSWLLTVSTATEAPEPLRYSAPQPGPQDDRAAVAPGSVATERRAVFDAASASWVDHLVVQRSTLTPGMALLGPAVVVEAQTTTVVGAGYVLGVDSGGNLVLDRLAQPVEGMPA